MTRSDDEFQAMQAAYGALEPLEASARERVFTYLESRLGRAGARAVSSSRSADGRAGSSDLDDGVRVEFEEFGELFDAFDAKTDVERALVAAYWSAKHESVESFDSQKLNTMLKNLGHGVTNITRALGGLADQKPALVIQTRKSGSTKQARKTYKITRSGINLVRERLDEVD